MWHSNYPYWNETLRSKHNFPALKISNKAIYLHVKKHNEEDFFRCITSMSPKANELASHFDALINATNSMNAIKLLKTCDEECGARERRKKAERIRNSKEETDVFE